jgi:hypothetical protein
VAGSGSYPVNATNRLIVVHEKRGYRNFEANLPKTPTLRELRKYWRGLFRSADHFGTGTYSGKIGETIAMKKPSKHLIAEVPRSVTKVGMTIGIDLGDVS